MLVRRLVHSDESWYNLIQSEGCVEGSGELFLVRSRNWQLIAAIAAIVGAVLLGIALIWGTGPEASATATPGPTQQADLAPTPSSTPFPTPPPPLTHTVSGGDTLSGIAQAYDVSVEELIEANDIENPDFLQIGQILIIPQGEALDAPAMGSPSDPAQSASDDEWETIELPTLTPSGPALIEFNTVLNIGDLESERVVLENRGGTVSLEGWTLSGTSGETFVFPALTLFPEAAVQVHSARGDDTPHDLYWGRVEPAWEMGELVTLRDADGNVVDTYIIPES